MDMTNIDAPDIPNTAFPSGGYPSSGKRLGPAWREIWATLANADGWTEGRALADEVAPRHGLAPVTLNVLISRAAKAGLLERNYARVTGARGPRTRTTYRIARG